MHAHKLVSKPDDLVVLNRFLVILDYLLIRLKFFFKCARRMGMPTRGGWKLNRKSTMQVYCFFMGYFCLSFIPRL